MELLGLHFGEYQIVAGLLLSWGYFLYLYLIGYDGWI